VRWFLAWVYRTRFWVRRGGRGHRVECPNCHARRHRIGGDWLLQCKRCGWKAGLPVLRWFTRSVPARQLRRTVVGPKLVLVVIAVAVIATGGVGAVTVPVDLPSTDAPGAEAATPTPASAQSPAPTDPPTDRPTDTEINTGDSTPTPFNHTRVEQTFLELLNTERQSRDLQTLSIREELTEMGESHADNMAEHSYMGHVQPDGTTISDRYRERGLLPECRLPIKGTDRYYAGAENAAYTYLYTRISGSNPVDYINSEEDLGRHLFHMWMNSKPHREAMLVYSADEMGLGFEVTEDSKVYAALELC